MGVKVRERPKGSGVWWIFVDHQGERKAKKIGDKKMALEAAKRIEAKLILSEPEVPRKPRDCPTFREYAGLWLETHASLSLKRSTRKVYQNMLKNHLLPAFGSKRLDEITARDISQFIIQKFRQGHKSQTVKNMGSVKSLV